MAGPMSRRLLTLTAVLLTLSATAFAQTTPPAQPTTPAAQPPRTDQNAQPQPIRVSIDVVAVDVQVIDRNGQPVPDLGPEKFSVTGEFEDRAAAWAEIEASLARYRPLADKPDL